MITMLKRHCHLEVSPLPGMRRAFDGFGPNASVVGRLAENLRVLQNAIKSAI
jgi:hypothetical protein